MKLAAGAAIPEIDPVLRVAALNREADREIGTEGDENPARNDEQPVAAVPEQQETEPGTDATQGEQRQSL
ncbi:MAG: hypothetical protein AB7F99_19705 [Vicinamibacterales bacterium]